jgi:hypothetical protein
MSRPALAVLFLGLGATPLAILISMAATTWWYETCWLPAICGED